MVLTIGLTIGVLIILVLLCIFGCKAAIRERLATMASEHFTTGTQSHTTSPAIPLEDVSETQISCRSDIPPSYDAATTYPTYTGKVIAIYRGASYDKYPSESVTISIQVLIELCII